MRETTLCREEMKNDLMKVFREVASQHTCHNNWEAWEMVVQHPAPRFYIDPRRAHQRLSLLLHGDTSKIDCLNPLKKEMYEALFAVVMKMWQKPAYWGKSLNYVLKFAVMEPAPRFYISTIRMGQIWREKQRQSLRKLAKTEGEILEKRKHIYETKQGRS